MKILPIRINGTNTAKKLKLQSSPDFLYYLPKQNVSSVFVSNSKKFYSSRPTTDIASKDFTGFLPANYTDAFYSKNTILSDANYDPSSGDNVLSVISNGITCFFIENEGSSLDSYGLSFNMPYKLAEIPNINSLIVLDITLNNNLIISIAYNSFYINTIATVKHPLLTQYYTTTLPNSDLEISL